MKIFLSTHGKMASGIKSSLNILMGKSEQVYVFDAHLPGSMDTVENEVEQFLDKCSPDETVILLSDIYGGSVNQSLAKYTERRNTYLITGVNLALILDLAVADCNFTREELLQKITAAKDAIRLVELEEKHQEESFF